LPGRGLYWEPAEEKLRVLLGAREREAPLTEAVERQGTLALEDGRIFRGRAAGASTRRGGEVVFNTSLTGYQEVFTDPSYAGQIVCLTYPHIGNVGTNLDDEESAIPHIESLIVREFSSVASNWRSGESAHVYLTRHGIPVLWDVDTRALVRHIRQVGALRGVVSTDGTAESLLVEEARALPSMAGQELASRVSSREQYSWDRGSIELTASPWHEATGEVQSTDEAQRFRVIAYDFGIKQNILRLLVDHNCDVVVVPAKTSAQDALALKPDGVFLSNGPGDPEPATYAIETIRAMLGHVPVFGICLGHQLCGLALGGKTFKLRFGHHGSNHPVKNLLTEQVEITAQNHGFCVDPDSLPASDVEVTHLNLNDQTNEGLRHRSLPLFSVQYHPEASPGPHDSHYLFRQFTETMKHWKLSGALRRGQAKA
jgi:carbamoyl-phosphate synthase small subunit